MRSGFLQGLVLGVIRPASLSLCPFGCLSEELMFEYVRLGGRLVHFEEVHVEFNQTLGHQDLVNVFVVLSYLKTILHPDL